MKGNNMRAYYLAYLGGLLVLEAAVITVVAIVGAQKEKQDKLDREERVAKEKKDRWLAAQRQAKDERDRYDREG